MTREEAINIMKVIVHMLEEKYDTDRVEEAVDMAIKALEQEPTTKENLVVGDCISRAELLKAVDTWDKFGCDTDTKLVPVKDCYVPYIHYDDVVKAIKGMPSVQPTAKENLVVGDCISREFIEIVVEYPPADLCTYPEYRGKPYFSIKYRENGKTYVGFGTYKIEILSQWIKEYFIPSIQPKPKADEPMQVELETDGYSDGELVYDYGKCPKCGWEFEEGDKDWEEPYCCHCGQKLHWFESEE